MRGTLPTFDEILDYLSQYTNYERVGDYRPGTGDFGTARIERLLQALDNPHTAYPVVHVAGTKGKGSVSHLSAAVLSTLGHKVGLYTSPHVSSIRERIAIDGVPVAESRWCEAFSEVRPVIDRVSQEMEEKPTWFEILTAMAFVVFARARVDAAVVEVGLGGRLDATNVHDLPVVVSAITPISKDHTRQLGEDLLTIAREKAGILRRGTTLVLGVQEKNVRGFLWQRAMEYDCPVYEIGVDVTVSAPAAQNTAPEAPQRLEFSTWNRSYEDVPLPLLGAHQRENAAMALAIAEVFQEHFAEHPIKTSVLRLAWRDISLPGRIELVDRKPWIVLDGAHNAASAWALAETLRARFDVPRLVLVFGANADKELELMLRILAPLCDELILTTTTSPRSMDPDAVAASLETDEDAPDVSVEADPVAALAQARKLAGEDGLVVATGSLYLAGTLRSACLPHA